MGGREVSLEERKGWVNKAKDFGKEGWEKISG